MTTHMGRSLVSALVLGACLLATGPVRGQDAAPQPPPMSAHFVQYGVGVGAETVASAGNVCPTGGQAPCILQSGAGLTVRVGYRGRGSVYFGGAYEFSRQDAANLLRLPILQQLRAELRYYLRQGTRLTPYAVAGAGGAVYGNEWRIDTGGGLGMLGLGLEFQVNRSSLVGGSLSYRPIVFRGWTDSTGQERANGFIGFGLSHFIALELTLELRDALSRW